jgi:hypothetical protein
MRRKRRSHDEGALMSAAGRDRRFPKHDDGGDRHVSGYMRFVSSVAIAVVAESNGKSSAKFGADEAG